ncbi:MAG: DUF2281 domain-containing protein [Leptolyngbyaceae cyanobacterium bins.59]|nr:DUF2281 domain-containing protein [Leptolyngbyaceae cyanobacterium bins.59]
MTLAEALLEKLQSLPPEKQQEVLDFAEFLYQKFQISDKSKNSSEVDPIWDLGSEPIQLGISDAAENHDRYLYAIRKKTT